MHVDVAEVDDWRPIQASATHKNKKKTSQPRKQILYFGEHHYICQI